MLINKTILILSPQNWGKMFVSKHHYAVELAKRGNHVYFLEPPDTTWSNRISIHHSKEHPGLHIISHSLNFPYNLKFHAMGIFHWLMQFHVRKILAKINSPVDIVWSFDLGNLYPFRMFPVDAVKIFHPVDEPLNSNAIKSASGADIIFSVTPEILAKFRFSGLPAFFINHGVADFFLDDSPMAENNESLNHIGLSGNLLRKDIDRPVLLKIVRENPDCIFEFWGSYNLGDANIGGDKDRETLAFIEALSSARNVTLHGSISAMQLAVEFRRIDVFLICYDIMLDQSKGTNYHKVLEYMSTGKVIISNNISAYSDKGRLLAMVQERTSNDELPSLFRQVMDNLAFWNSIQLMNERKMLAFENSYRRQVERINVILENNKLRQPPGNMLKKARYVE